MNTLILLIFLIEASDQIYEQNTNESLVGTWCVDKAGQQFTITQHGSLYFKDPIVPSIVNDKENYSSKRFIFSIRRFEENEYLYVFNPEDKRQVMLPYRLYQIVQKDNGVLLKNLEDKKICIKQE